MFLPRRPRVRRGGVTSRHDGDVKVLQRTLAVGVNAPTPQRDGVFVVGVHHRVHTCQQIARHMDMFNRYLTTMGSLKQHRTMHQQLLSRTEEPEKAGTCARNRRALQQLALTWPDRERNVFYLTTHSTHFIYGYMASDIWLRTILIVTKETRCRHIGYSFRLAARVILYASSHRQDNTYHGLCYTSRGALAYLAWRASTAIPVNENRKHCHWPTGRKGIFLTTHPTHSIYGYMASDIC